MRDGRPGRCPQVDRTEGWPPIRTPETDRWTESRLQAGSPSPAPDAGTKMGPDQRCPGHQSAMETLDAYGHRWPDSVDETHAAVDATPASLAGTA